MSNKFYNAKDFGLDLDLKIECDKPFDLSLLNLKTKDLSLIKAESLLNFFSENKSLNNDDIDDLFEYLKKEFKFYLIPIKKNNENYLVVDTKNSKKAMKFISNNLNVDITFKLEPFSEKNNITFKKIFEYSSFFIALSYLVFKIF